MTTLTLETIILLIHFIPEGKGVHNSDLGQQKDLIMINHRTEWWDQGPMLFLRQTKRIQ